MSNSAVCPPVRLKNLELVDHEFSLPLDHARRNGPALTVFARELRLPDRAAKPWLVFLQGGPGSAAPRPAANTAWWTRALAEYNVLLLDQRGTGRSTPVTAQTLAHLDGAAQAEYLRHFRADAIVRDCERIRVALLGKDSKWTVLGQSYGGFCTLTYLSLAPEGLAEAVITGGLAALDAHPDAIYRLNYRRVLEANRRYFARYPGDVERVADIARRLREPVRLPRGDLLTPRRFRQLGFWLGMSDGAEIVHYLLEEAFVAVPGGLALSENFLVHFEQALHFDTNPIFSVLHEACYTQGFASNWSATRVLEEFPELSGEEPFYFTGEMIFPWMFDEYRGLRPFKDAAERLARYDAWPRLYDVARLRENQVPTAAALYDGDFYVPRELSEATARTVKGLRLWVTNEYAHNGLRENGDHVLGRLLDMLHGKAETY